MRSRKLLYINYFLKNYEILLDIYHTGNWSLVTGHKNRFLKPLLTILLLSFLFSLLPPSDLSS